MSKKVITIIAIILSVTLIATSVAAIAAYVSRANVGFLNCRVENLGTASSDYPGGNITTATLTVKTKDGTDLGSTADITPDTVSLPILSEVTPTVSLDYPKQPGRWRSAEGRAPVDAPAFAISSKDGESTDVTFKIVAHGSDPARAALRFGINIKYYSEDLDQTLIRNGQMQLDYRSDSTSTIPLGDGNILEGEEVEVYISVWIDKDALDEVGVYTNDDLQLEAVVTAGEIS